MIAQVGTLVQPKDAHGTPMFWKSTLEGKKMKWKFADADDTSWDVTDCKSYSDPSVGTLKFDAPLTWDSSLDDTQQVRVDLETEVFTVAQGKLNHKGFEGDSHVLEDIRKGDASELDIQALCYALQGCQHRLVDEANADVYTHSGCLKFDQFQRFAEDDKLTVADCVSALRVTRNTKLAHKNKAAMGEDDFKEVTPAVVVIVVVVLVAIWGSSSPR